MTHIHVNSHNSPFQSVRWGRIQLAKEYNQISDRQNAYGTEFCVHIMPAADQYLHAIYIN